MMFDTASINSENQKFKHVKNTNPKSVNLGMAKLISGVIEEENQQNTNDVTRREEL